MFGAKKSTPLCHCIIFRTNEAPLLYHCSTFGLTNPNCYIIALYFGQGKRHFQIISLNLGLQDTLRYHCNIFGVNNDLFLYHCTVFRSHFYIVTLYHCAIFAAIIVCRGSANERLRHNVTSFLMGWAHTRNNLWMWRTNTAISQYQYLLFRTNKSTLPYRSTQTRTNRITLLNNNTTFEAKETTLPYHYTIFGTNKHTPL